MELFSFPKKKKGYKKEVGERAARPLIALSRKPASLRLCGSLGSLIWVEAFRFADGTQAEPQIFPPSYFAPNDFCKKNAEKQRTAERSEPIQKSEAELLWALRDARPQHTGGRTA